MPGHDLIGRPINALDTPALLLDLDAFERNLRTMADFLAPLPCKLRPHAKTHKCVEIARRQMAAGAIGITCAKLGEAEVMADGGIEDILIANQVVGHPKVERAARLAKRCRLTVAVDNLDNVRELAVAAKAAGTTIGVLVEANIGMDRCGVDREEDAIALARQVRQSKGLEFRGLMGYEGHAVFIESEAERRAAAEKAMARLIEFRDALIGAGLPVEIVSSGGTGTYKFTGTTAGITELQCGSYCVMDARYHKLLPEFDCALTLLATVISRPTADRVILDVGRKAVGFDFGNPEPVDASLEVYGLSEEHAKARITDPSLKIALGDKLQLLPSHCCTTINLHDEYFVVRNRIIEAVWPIGARGPVSVAR